MDIIDDRYNEASTIVSSQIPVSAWYELIGEGTIADAILDRIVNSSHRIKLEGDSLRKGKLKSIQLKNRIIAVSFKVAPFDRNRWHGPSEIASFITAKISTTITST